MALRIGFDVGAIWIAFLLGWVLVKGNDFSVLSEKPFYVMLLAGLFPILGSIAYTRAGLHSHTHTCPLLTKIVRILCVNSALFAIFSAVLLLAELTAPPVAVSLWPVALLSSVAFVASTVVLCLGRIASVVLRSEDAREEHSRRPEEADPSKVLVIGGGGYIGSALVEALLKQDLQVLVLDAMHFGDEPLARVAGHPRLALIRADFRHIEALTRAMSGVGDGASISEASWVIRPARSIPISRSTSM